MQKSTRFFIQPVAGGGFNVFDANTTVCVGHTTADDAMQLAVDIVGYIVPNCLPYHVGPERMDELTLMAIRAALRLPGNTDDTL